MSTVPPPAQTTPHSCGDAINPVRRYQGLYAILHLLEFYLRKRRDETRVQGNLGSHYGLNPEPIRTSTHGRLPET